MYSIACRLYFFQNISHWLFAIAIFSRVCHHFEQQRMRVFGRGNNDGIDDL